MANGVFSVPPLGLSSQLVTTQILFGAGKRRRTPTRVKKRSTTRVKRAAAPRGKKRGSVVKRKGRGVVATRRRSATGKKKPARMVKGSVAAKRHMAKLRKMRRSR